MELDGNVSLATGAGSGIGRAIALRLANEGASVVVADVDEATGAETVRLIDAAGGRAAFVRADVAREPDTRAMVEFARETFGGLDVLVNNAGFANDVSFPDAPLERWRGVIDVCLLGTMYATQHAVAAMRGRGGAIVNIASMAGLGFAPHGSPEYAAAKAGVVRLSASLATLNESAGVRVNCVCPDWVDTPASRRYRATMSPEELASVPPKMLTPEDIADAVVELIRDDSLAGRVMICPLPDEPRRLLRVSKGS